MPPQRQTEGMVALDRRYYEQQKEDDSRHIHSNRGFEGIWVLTGEPGSSEVSKRLSASDRECSKQIQNVCSALSILFVCFVPPSVERSVSHFTASSAVERRLHDRGQIRLPRRILWHACG
jgi:hypothetical protein